MCVFFSNTLHQLFFFVVFRPRRVYVISSVVFNLYFLLRYICFEKNLNEERYIYIRPSIDFFFLFSFTQRFFSLNAVCVCSSFSQRLVMIIMRPSTVEWFVVSSLLFKLACLSFRAFNIKRTHALEVKFKHTCENELSWYKKKK